MGLCVEEPDPDGHKEMDRLPVMEKVGLCEAEGQALRLPEAVGEAVGEGDGQLLALGMALRD